MSTPLIGILSVIIVVLDVVNGIAKGWKKVKPSGCDFERELAAQKVVINLMVDKGSAFYMSFNTLTAGSNHPAHYIKFSHKENRGNNMIIVTL